MKDGALPGVIDTGHHREVPVQLDEPMCLEGSNLFNLESGNPRALHLRNCFSRLEGGRQGAAPLCTAMSFDPVGELRPRKTRLSGRSLPR
jgi:hypothetical protein